MNTRGFRACVSLAGVLAGLAPGVDAREGYLTSSGPSPIRFQTPRQASFSLASLDLPAKPEPAPTPVAKPEAGSPVAAQPAGPVADPVPAVVAGGSPPPKGPPTPRETPVTPQTLLPYFLTHTNLAAPGLVMPMQFLPPAPPTLVRSSTATFTTLP